MERWLRYEISPADAGVRTEVFLRRKGFSRQNLVELKKMPMSVLANGRFQKMNQGLQNGDILDIHIQDEASSQILPVKLPLTIIYEDEDLVVVDKPAGMPIHPSILNYDNTLANALTYYYEKQGKSFVFRCCNRLDRDTSGLTVVAKHMVSANILSVMGTKRQIHREYLAIVRGSVTPPSGTVDAPIGRAEDSIIARRIDPEHGERAVTHYQTVRESNGLTLLSLVLETGRTHQIRVHMQYLGYPLLGDHLYNPEDRTLISRQALHAHCLSFVHPLTKQPLTFTSPLPADMAGLMGNYNGV